MPKQDVSIARYFADLPDPRVDRTKKHALGDILAIIPNAVDSLPYPRDPLLREGI